MWIKYKGYNDIEVGDILEVYEEIAVKKKIEITLVYIKTPSRFRGCFLFD